MDHGAAGSEEGVDGAAAAAAPTVLGLQARREERPQHDRDEHCPIVVKVVFDSFNELVMEGDAADKDVVLELYQEGCRACGALTPRMRMVARMLASESGGGAVRVAVLNSTKNHPLPAAVASRSFPRVVVFPAGRKDRPLMLRMLEEGGGRQGLPTVRDILTFLESTSETGFRATAAMLRHADALEEEAEVLGAIVDRAAHLESLGVVLKEGVAGVDGLEQAAFGRTTRRFADRSKFVFEGVTDHVDEGKAQALDVFVGTCEGDFVNLARAVPLAPSKTSGASFAMGLQRLLGLYDGRLAMWEDVTGGRSRHVAARGRLLAASARAELLLRLEERRARLKAVGAGRA